MSITENRLNEIQERLNAATEGPWNTECAGAGHVWSRSMGSGVAWDCADEDADLIAEAPTDLADLLAEVHRLRDELAKAREVTREKLDDATYAVASVHHPFPSGCLCGYKSARKRDVTEHILDQFIAALGGGDDA